MDRKPEFFRHLDRKLRNENYIPENSKCIVSVFLPNGELWPVDFGVKQQQFETTILIPTNDIEDPGRKFDMMGMRSYVFYPKEVIYNFRVRGCMVMFDYIKEDWVKQREQEKQAKKEEQQAALEALTIDDDE